MGNLWRHFIPLSENLKNGKKIVRKMGTPIHVQRSLETISTFNSARAGFTPPSVMTIRKSTPRSTPPNVSTINFSP